MARTYTKAEQNLIESGERFVKLLRAYVPRTNSLVQNYARQAEFLREQGKLPEGVEPLLSTFFERNETFKQQAIAFAQALEVFKNADFSAVGGDLQRIRRLTSELSRFEPNSEKYRSKQQELKQCADARAVLAQRIIRPILDVSNELSTLLRFTQASGGFTDFFEILNALLIDSLLALSPQRAALLRKEYYQLEDLNYYLAKNVLSIQQLALNAYNEKHHSTSVIKHQSHRHHSWLSEVIQFSKRMGVMKKPVSNKKDKINPASDKEVFIRVGIRKDLVRDKESYLKKLILQIAEEVRVEKEEPISELRKKLEELQQEEQALKEEERKKQQAVYTQRREELEQQLEAVESAINRANSFAKGVHVDMVITILTEVVLYLTKQAVDDTKALFSQSKTTLYVTITCDGSTTNASYSNKSTPALVYTSLNIKKELLKEIMIGQYDAIPIGGKLKQEFWSAINDKSSVKATKKDLRHEITHAFDLGTKDKSSYSLYVETKALIGREPSRLAIAAVNALLTSRKEAITRLAENHIGVGQNARYPLQVLFSALEVGLQTFSQLVQEALENPEKLTAFENNRTMGGKAYPLGEGLALFIFFHTVRPPVLYIPERQLDECVSIFEEVDGFSQALSQALKLEGVREIPHQKVGVESKALPRGDLIGLIYNPRSKEEYQRLLLQVLKKIHMMDAPTFFQSGKRALEYYGFDVKFSFIEQLKLESKQEEKEMKGLLKHYGL